MSRQWGHWRLGRGDGGHYSEDQSLVRLIGTFTSACSAMAISTAQIARIARTISLSQLPTSYSSILASASDPVTSPQGSIHQVLPNR